MDNLDKQHVIVVVSNEHYVNMGDIDKILPVRFATSGKERLVTYTLPPDWIEHGDKSHRVPLLGLPSSRVPLLRPYVSDLQTMLRNNMEEYPHQGVYILNDLQGSECAVGDLIIAKSSDGNSILMQVMKVRTNPVMIRLFGEYVVKVLDTDQNVTMRCSFDKRDVQYYRLTRVSNDVLESSIDD